MANKMMETTKKGDVVVPIPGDVVKMTLLKGKRNSYTKGQKLYLIVLAVSWVAGEKCIVMTNEEDSIEYRFLWYLDYSRGCWSAGGRGMPIDCSLSIVRTLKRIVLPKKQFIPD
jgi:hypothetical protein